MKQTKKGTPGPQKGQAGQKMDPDMFKKRVEEQKAIEKTLSKIDNKIVVLSGKGGVGKSTVVVNLAYALAAQGKKVGIMDVDITGPDIAMMMGLEGQRAVAKDERTLVPLEGPKGVKVMSMSFLLQSSDQAVVWRGPMKMGLIKEFFVNVEWGELDYLVVDLPPGTSDEPLSIAQYIKDCDGAIIVTTPQEVSLLDISKAVTFTRMLKMPVLGLVENMSGFECPHCGKAIEIFEGGDTRSAANKMDVPYLGSIPLDPEISKTGDAGAPFLSRGEESPSTTAFNGIVEHIVRLVEKEGRGSEEQEGEEETGGEEE